MKIIGVRTKEELQKQANEELNEEQDRLPTDLQTLKDWVKKQPHLDGHIPTDDNLLTYFLRGCKFSLERTKEKLDFFYSIRANCPEWFDNWNVDEDRVKGWVKRGMFIRFKGYDKHGRYVFYQNAAELNPDAEKLEDQFRIYFIMQDSIMHDLDQSSVTGFAGIINMEGMTMKHAALHTPSLGMKSMKVWQDAYPSRPKQVHMLNMPTVMEAAFNLFKSFASDKMKERLHAYPAGSGNVQNTLIEALGPEVLPKELGGTNGTMQDHIDYTVNIFEERRQWFKDQTKFKAAEAKRPGKAKTYEDIFGMEGSFRKLTVD